MAGKLAIHITAVKHNTTVPQLSSFESMGSGSFSTARTCSNEKGALHITYRSGLRAVHCLGRARKEGQGNAMCGVQSWQMISERCVEGVAGQRAAADLDGMGGSRSPDGLPAALHNAHLLPAQQESPCLQLHNCPALRMGSCLCML